MKRNLVKWRDVAALVAAAVVGVVLAGCGGAHFPKRGAESLGSARSVAGDFDDVDAAVDVACSVCELAVVTKSSDEDGTRRFEMVTVTDEPAWATARESSDGVVEMRVRIRDVGDAAWEDQFLDAVQKRLWQLKGVTSAPVRGFEPFDTK